MVYCFDCQQDNLILIIIPISTTDASASGVSDARELWANKRKPFTAEFIELDPSDDDFEAQVQEKGIQADIVCCMQHLQIVML